MGDDAKRKKKEQKEEEEKSIKQSHIHIPGLPYLIDAPSKQTEKRTTLLPNPRPTPVRTNLLVKLPEPSVAIIPREHALVTSIGGRDLVELIVVLRGNVLSNPGSGLRPATAE